MAAEESSDGKPARLASLDALRGFNMFFITGGSALIAGICSALKCPNAWIATQMKHVEWVGFAHHDTIFPLFLFLAGVSWPFSLASQQGRGRSAWAIQLKALARVALLFLFGLSSCSRSPWFSLRATTCSCTSVRRPVRLQVRTRIPCSGTTRHTSTA